MFLVGRNLDRVHRKHIPPVLQHGRFHAFLHVQFFVWMILHNAVNRVGELAVQRRNRVWDLDFRTGILTGEQDSER